MYRQSHEKGGSPEVVCSPRNRAFGNLCETDGVCIAIKTVYSTHRLKEGKVSICDSNQLRVPITSRQHSFNWSRNTGATLIPQPMHVANNIGFAMA